MVSSNMKSYDLAVIGGGPAGMAAAIAAREAGCRDVVIIERDRRLGGILGQCIHDGFGLHRFGEALSGPEYAARYERQLQLMDIRTLLGTIVLSLSPDKRLLLSSAAGLSEVEAKSVVLAMGCRERTRGALSIPGHRPAGVYTAGSAQNLVNLQNIMPGSRVCVLGSGDIGLIMARRMVLEGAEVEAVFEVLPYSSGLPRNIRQCLDDYNIPLFLSRTVVEIIGRNRLEGVHTAAVDEKRQPIPGTERFTACDTLLLSVGLIPENELAREAGVEMDPVTGGPVVDSNCMTSRPGIFSCGNALHVHDLVDWVSEEAARAGASAASFALGAAAAESALEVHAGEGVRYVVPRRLAGSGKKKVALRVLSPSKNGVVTVSAAGRVIKKERFKRLHPAEMVWLDVDLPQEAALPSPGSLEVNVG